MAAGLSTPSAECRRDGTALTYGGSPKQACWNIGICRRDLFGLTRAAPRKPPLATRPHIVIINFAHVLNLSFGRYIKPIERDLSRFAGFEAVVKRQ